MPAAVSQPRPWWRPAPRPLISTTLPQRRPPGHQVPWPLVSALDLGMLPSAVPCARHYTAYILSEWDHLSHLAEDAQVIVSELVTNAVCHGRGPVTVCLRASSERLLIEVWDALQAAPAPCPHAIGADRGYGLGIVATLSRDWGYYPGGGGGKTVWAELPL
jgi:anti-sigma regulatory factor (Ser/Thr protein kinase)